MRDRLSEEALERLHEALGRQHGVADLAISVLEEDLRAAEALVRWLAAPWGPNDPAFPKTDPRTGQPLPENGRLERTWYAIVRGSEPAGHSWGDVPVGATIIEHELDPSTGETDRREASASSLSSTDPGDKPPGH